MKRLSYIDDARYLKVKTLKAQMQQLRIEIATFTEENVQMEQQDPASTEYYANEEELAKETEWNVQYRRNIKKRKVVS